jgi:hypothetical protein
MNFVLKYITLKLTSLLFLLVLIPKTGCDDDPEKEDTPELITKVTLTFTPVGGGAALVFTANDPDGDGSIPPTINDIELASNTTYTLTIEFENGLVSPPEDITEEVEDEDDEHMFFFGWTGNIFSDPAGNGNIDTRADAVNYNDEDDNGNPVGLNTNWTTVTAGGTATGTLRILLKHQPDLKSATSGSGDGETDVDLTFDVIVQS